MGSGDGNWCLIESDPGVFTSLIRDIGVKSMQVEEIYSLDPGTLEALKPVYGLIFLFKWRSNDKDDRPVVQDHSERGIFFANQVINNACATQALLAILLNNADIDIGPELKNFKDFTKDFPPELKGVSISNSDLIRNVHNSFARPESFLIDDAAKNHSGGDEDVFHFIAYVPIGGRLYELDGLKAGPIDLGPYDASSGNCDWLTKITPVIQSRMEKYCRSEVHFNLMGLIDDQVDKWRRVIERKETELKEKLEEEKAAGLDVQAELKAEIQDLKTGITNAKELMKMEEDKMEKYRVENIRRKHNYIPFFMETLKLLAEKGELKPLIEKAKQQQQRQQHQMA
eukprot:Nk52_evm20s271 gene=Nk52_evmTU20s271